MQADFKSNSAGIIDVMSAGYGRDLFFFGVGQAPPGGVSKMGCNVWWQPALVLRNESYKFYYSPYNKDCV